MLLSDMKEAGMIDECGLFSKIGSTLKKVVSTTAGKIGTIATVAACAVVGTVCAIVPGGQLMTAACIGVAVGAVGGSITAAAATYEADGKVDMKAVGICAGVGAVVGGAVSAAAYGVTTAIKTATSNVKAGKTNCTGGSCFTAGTLICCESGYATIENIKTGDKVWATNPQTGATELKEVVKLFRNETYEWVHLTVNGEEIVCTPTHPFYLPTKGWTAACHLRAGDILVTVNGEYVVVEQIAHELLEEPDVTYNFEVEDFHTYYVGKNTVLVHNKCILSPKEFFNKPKTAKEVIAYLKNKGFTIVKQEGSHVKLTNGVYTTVVPNHGSKDIAIGTLKAIMKEAGLG